MASSKEYLNFILDQLSGLNGISYRAMMGEYIIYYNEKVVGGIYDDRFLIKPVKSAVAMLPDAKTELPYEGGKEMLLVEDVDNRKLLQDLLQAMYEELPAKKKWKHNKLEFIENTGVNRMLENTKLFFLKEDIFKEFGIEEGEKLYQNVEKIYNELISSANYRESEAIKHHLITNLFPTMAYYKALLDNGYNIDTALSYVRKETKKSAEMKRIENQKMSKMPFTYLMYRLAVKGVMKKNFPDEGFETEWIRCDKTEIHFDLHRCIYNDLTKEYECPELCTVFCENDDIAFNGLMPKIRFERNGTLGQGMNKCDFHLINNRKKNR